jgi:hypothetical protein
VAQRDLVGNILDGLETGRAEPVDAGGTGCVWDSGRQSRGTEEIWSLAIADLLIVSLINFSVEERKGEAYIAQADILNQSRVDLGLLQYLLQ